MELSYEEFEDMVIPVLDKYGTEEDLKWMGYYDRVLKEAFYRVTKENEDEYETKDEFVTAIQDQTQVCIDYILWEGLRLLEKETDDNEIWSYM